MSQQIASVHPEMLPGQSFVLPPVQLLTGIILNPYRHTKHSSEHGQVFTVTDTPVNEILNIHPPFINRSQSRGPLKTIL